MARASLCSSPMTSVRLRPTRTLRSRGFTLIELAVVVVIVGVLAMIALVGYRRLILSSKLTEARSMLQGIRVAQEGYKAERGVYANVGNSKGCPQETLANTTNNKTQWNTACSGGTLKWSVLQIHSDGPVQFQYFTTAGVGGDPDMGTWVTDIKKIGDGNRPWYTATAKADLDGDTGNDPTELVTTSGGSEIYVRYEGQ